MNSIELLESRIAPSVTVLPIVNGVLTIQHVAPSGEDNLTVMQTGVGAFHVNEANSAFDFDTPDPVNSIDVQLGETSDTVAFQFTSAGLDGTLNIDTGDADTGTFKNSVTFGSIGSSSRIGGAVTVMGGADTDNVEFFFGVGLKKTFTFIGEGGTDQVKGDGFSVAKTVFIDNVEDTTFQPISPITFGALNIDQDEAASDVTFSLSNIVAIKGKLTYCGTNDFVDNVTLAGQVGGAAKLMLVDGTNRVLLASRMASTLNITGGGDADSITFTDAQTALIDPAIVPNNIAINAKTVKISLGDGENVLTLQKGAHFYSSLNFNTGTEKDTVNLGDVYVQKNLKLNLGTGPNFLNHVEGTHGIGKSFKYVGSGGDDTLAIDGITTGKMALKLGDGANGVTGTAQILGSSVSILGGAEVDTLSVGFNSNSAKLKAKLFGSDDSFTYNGGALVSAIIDGGTNTTLSPGDTFTNENALPANHTLIGFESPP